MSTGFPPDRRRTLWSIAGIIAICVAAIAVTAILTRHNDVTVGSSQASSRASALPAATPIPENVRILLDHDRVMQIADTTLKLIHDAPTLNPPNVMGDVSVRECAWEYWVGPAEAYTDVEWSNVQHEVLANKEEYKQVQQLAVRLDASGAGREVLDGFRRNWQQCRDKPYTDQTGNTYVLTDIQEPDDLIIAHRETQRVDWVCEHAVAARASYVLEVAVCGLGAGMAETVAREMMANIKE